MGWTALREISALWCPQCKKTAASSTVSGGFFTYIIGFIAVWVTIASLCTRFIAFRQNW